MPITKYEDLTLEKQSFIVDDCYFINCVLRDCDLFYSGGDVDFVNLNYQNCRWHWRGAAGKTVELLTLLGLLTTPQTQSQMTVSNTKSN